MNECKHPATLDDIRKFNMDDKNPHHPKGRVWETHNEVFYIPRYDGVEGTDGAVTDILPLDLE